MEGLLDWAGRFDLTDLHDLDRKILDVMADYRQDDPPGDDQSLVLLHHNASDPPHQSIGQKIRVTATMLGLLPFCLKPG